MNKAGMRSMNLLLTCIFISIGYIPVRISHKMVFNFVKLTEHLIKWFVQFNLPASYVFFSLVQLLSRV